MAACSYPLRLPLVGSALSRLRCASLLGGRWATTRGAPGHLPRKCRGGRRALGTAEFLGTVVGLAPRMGLMRRRRGDVDRDNTSRNASGPPTIESGPSVPTRGQALSPTDRLTAVSSRSSGQSSSDRPTPCSTSEPTRRASVDGSGGSISGLHTPFGGGGVREQIWPGTGAHVVGFGCSGWARTRTGMGYSISLRTYESRRPSRSRFHPLRQLISSDRRRRRTAGCVFACRGTRRLSRGPV